MEDFLVFDLETQRSAQEVGGWDNIPDMKMSVGVLWDSRTKDFSAYFEDQVEKLIEHLKSGPRVIGYNHLYFDYPVLSGYYKKGDKRKALLESLIKLKNLDLLVDLKERLQRRIKLDSVVRPTLAVGKSADGLMALEWYKEWVEGGDQKKMDLIVEYCKQDVAVTRDLYLYGLKSGEVSYDSKSGGIRKLEVDWTEKEEKPPPAEQLSF